MKHLDELRRVSLSSKSRLTSVKKKHKAIFKWLDRLNVNVVMMKTKPAESKVSKQV